MKLTKSMLLSIMAVLFGACSTHQEMVGTPQGFTDNIPRFDKIHPMRDADVLYGVIAKREEFAFPSNLSDFTLDEAMRMGTFPRSGEPEQISSDYGLLSIQFSHVMQVVYDKYGQGKAIELLLNMAEKHGVIWPAVAFVQSIGVDEDVLVSANRETTFCRLSLIKDERKRRGAWHP